MSRKKHPGKGLIPNEILELLKRRRYVFFLLLFVGFALYLNVLNGEFVFDDDLLITRNILIRSFANIPEFFSNNISSGAFISGGNFFRPLQMIVYTAIYSLFELSPFPYHLTSVLVHIINSYFVFSLLKKLKLKDLSSLIAALIFLTHPVQTQAVSYISGLADPLGLFFFLAGLLIFVDLLSETTGKKMLFRSVIASFLFLLAVLSKENLVVQGLLLIVFLIAYWRKRVLQLLRAKLALTALINLLMLGYLYLRFSSLNFTDGFGLASAQSIYSTNLWVRIATFINNIWEYFKLIFFPKDLFYEKPAIIYNTVLTAKGFFGSVAILFGVFAIVSSHLRKRPVLFIASSWILISFLPFTGIVPLNAFYLDHWLYVPLVGIVMLCAFYLDSLDLNGKHRNTFIGILLILILFGVRVVARNTEWADPLKFYQNELNYNQESARLYNNIAMIFSTNGDFEKGISSFQRAIELNDTYPQTRHNLGNVYLQTGNINDAVEQYVLSLQLDPNFIYSHGKLKVIFEKAGDLKRASEFEQFVVRIGQGGQVFFDEIEDVLGGKPNK